MSLAVLHVTQPCDGGVARYVLDASRDQQARGWAVTVACPDGPLADDLAHAGIPRVSWLAVRQPGPVSVAEAVRLRALTARVRPDVVHLHASKAGLAGRLGLRDRGLPTMFQPHGWSWLAVTGPMRAASLHWERAAAGWTDLLLCVSEAERRQGRARGVHGRYAVVRNGVDLGRFRPADTAARSAARTRLGLPVDAPLAVCVGRLTRQKGQDVLLTAWPAVRARCPAGRLALVGGGDQSARLRAAWAPGVIFAGPVDDVRDWLAAADVVVLPSRWEGMSLTVLEALATGRSVVVSDVAGLGEVVTAGVGARVPVDDPAALGAALIVRLADPTLARTEGAAAARYAARFDVRHTFDRLAAETARVAAKKGRISAEMGRISAEKGAPEKTRITDGQERATC